MRVLCVSTYAERLPHVSYDPGQGLSRQTEFPITVGEEYAVSAITVFRGSTWYYIHDDDGLDWPTWVPASQFEIADASLPASWLVGYFFFSAESQYPIISFPEWALDHYFYERLVDGDPATTRIYASRREEIARSGRAGGTAARP